MPKPLLHRHCPHADCPSHERGENPRIVRHSRFHNRRGPRRRLLCRVCGRTFVATLGTPYYRLRGSREEFDAVMRLVVEGNTQASISRSRRMSPATVSRWIERGARHTRAFVESRLRLPDAVEMQLDELKCRAGQRDRHWVYNGIEVWSRVWAGFLVGPRTLRSTLIFVRGLRTACELTPDPVLFASDAFKYYAPTLRRTFGPTCVHVEVSNHYRRDRILRSESRPVLGTPAQFERARARSEDSRRPNTAYVERLNLFVRRSCATLHRRTPSPMRKPQRLDQMLQILRCYYNFIRPHASLPFGRVTRTPAMQAGITKQKLTFREVFTWVPPLRSPPRRLAYGQWV